MPITHKKKFGVYFYDGFDHDVSLRYEADTFEEARDYVYDHYNITPNRSIDGIDIVDLNGKIQFRYNISGEKYSV